MATPCTYRVPQPSQGGRNAPLWCRTGTRRTPLGCGYIWDEGGRRTDPTVGTLRFEGPSPSCTGHTRMREGGGARPLVPREDALKPLAAATTAFTPLNLPPSLILPCKAWRTRQAEPTWRTGTAVFCAEGQCVDSGWQRQSRGEAESAKSERRGPLRPLFRHRSSLFS